MSIGNRTHHLPPLDAQVTGIRNSFQQTFGTRVDPIHVVVSPYRICPIGAHVDHQGGEVLGLPLNAYSLVAFEPAGSPTTTLHSTLYPQSASFTLDDIPPPDFKSWARYASGAAAVLKARYPLTQGVCGVVGGTLPGSGLSSSASVGVALLTAFAAANDIVLTKPDFVELDRQLENDYLGLDNGIQDQTAIVFGQRNKLVHINSVTREVGIVEAAAGEDVCFIVAYSGFSRELTATGFNDRVGECRQAAAWMGNALGKPATLLGDITPNEYLRLRPSLPEPLGRRADHYFSETGRVAAGRDAWQAADYREFGKLMNASCASSINNYQSGTEPIIFLAECLQAASGVLGARFSGGGYGGCAVALTHRTNAVAALEETRVSYLARYPEKESLVRFFIAEPEDGCRLLTES